MSVLFANAAANQRTTSGHLLEFKAGRSALEQGSTPATRKVVSDKAKGTIFIKQSQDQLMHFCWKNRESGNVEIDLIVFPGDTEFIPVKECKDGRVFILKFKSGGDRRIFWMQEPKPDKDDEICKKVNDLLNNPPALRSTGGRSTTEKSSAFGNLANFSGALGNGEDMGAFSNMDQNQLMQLLSLMNSGGAADALLPQLSLNANAAARESPSATPPPRTAQNAAASKAPAQAIDANQAIQLSQLRDILSSIPATSSRQQRNVVELSEVLAAKNVRDSALANKDRLISHLPDQEEKTEQELKETLTAPQFRQAVDTFGHALQTGQLGPALQHFNVGEAAVNAANSGDLLAFSKKLTEVEQKTGGKSTDDVNAQINAEAKAEESTESAIQEPKPKRGKKDDDDDNMGLD
uniref:Proteasomal ubiquitin receptor ADRM1 homolog n=2 Tax=Acrobeloides nanus TaxID=290746 RepID=A0A914DT43_9BILA